MIVIKVIYCFGFMLGNEETALTLTAHSSIDSLDGGMLAPLSGRSKQYVRNIALLYWDVSGAISEPCRVCSGACS
jgi:hypothetical protein